MAWMHEVKYSKEARDFLDKAPKDIRRRIMDKILDARAEPFHYFSRLSGRSDYKLRAGNYRIIADIENNKIMVRMIGHRKNVYKFSFFSFFY